MTVNIGARESVSKVSVRTVTSIDTIATSFAPAVYGVVWQLLGVLSAVLSSNGAELS